MPHDADTTTDAGGAVPTRATSQSGARPRAGIGVSVLLALLAAALLSGCASTGRAAPGELTVSAASSLREPFAGLATAFQESEGVAVTLNTAASGVLQKQIEGGAPADVFASAGPEQVEALVAKQLVDPASVTTFAGNEIVLAVPKGSTLDLKGFADLADARVRRVVTGNPEVAPHGKIAVQVLKSLGLFDALSAKMVYSENVGQTHSYVARGEVDAGLMFRSEAAVGDDLTVVATAPAGSHEPIRYVMAVVAASPKQEAAQAFVDLVLSPRGQAILARYGFAPAP